RTLHRDLNGGIISPTGTCSISRRRRSAPTKGRNHRADAQLYYSKHSTAVVTDLVALVTGASSDIGEAITRGLADAGACVLGAGRNQEKLARVAAARVGQIETVAADLTSAAGLEAIRARISRRGRLDILILGSGIYERS